MSNTDFEDSPNGETASEELVLDATGAGEEAHDEADAPDQGDAEVDAQDGQEVRRPSRRDTRIQTLLERTETEKARADRFERELMEIRAERQAQQQRTDPAREEERLAMMTPEERADYKLNNALNQLRREQALTSFKMQDESDKARFDAKATTDKVYAKYADKVEQERLKYMREQNTVIPREELLKWIVGADVLNNRGRNTAKATKQGRENIQRQQAPLANGRGNTQADRRSAQADTPQARAARLANVSL